MSIYNSPQTNPLGQLNPIFNAADYTNSQGEIITTNKTQDILGGKTFKGGASFQNGLNVKGGMTTDTLSLTSGLITSNFSTLPTYTQYQIGYTIRNIVPAFAAATGVLSTIVLPCYGVWFVNYGVAFTNTSATPVTFTNTSGSISIAGAAYNPVGFSISQGELIVLNSSYIHQPATAGDLTVSLTAYQYGISATLSSLATSDTTYPNLTFFTITRLA